MMSEQLVSVENAQPQSVDDCAKQAIKELLDNFTPTELIEEKKNKLEMLKHDDVNLTWLQAKLKSGETLPPVSGAVDSSDYRLVPKSQTGLLSFLQPGQQSPLPNDFDGEGVKGMLPNLQWLYCSSGTSVMFWNMIDMTPMPRIDTQFEDAIEWILEVSIVDTMIASKDERCYDSLGLLLASPNHLSLFGRPRSPDLAWINVWNLKVDTKLTAITAFRGRILMCTTKCQINEIVKCSPYTLLWGAGQGVAVRKLFDCSEQISQFTYNDYSGVLYGLSHQGTIFVFDVQSNKEMALLLSVLTMRDILTSPLAKNDGITGIGDVIHLSPVQSTIPTVLATTSNLTRIVLSALASQDGAGHHVLHIRRPHSTWSDVTVEKVEQVVPHMIVSIKENGSLKALLVSSTNGDRANWHENIINMHMPFELLSVVQVEAESSLKKLLDCKASATGIKLLTNCGILSFQVRHETAMVLHALQCCENDKQENFKSFMESVGTRQTKVSLLEIFCLINVPSEVKESARDIFMKKTSENNMASKLEAVDVLLGRILRCRGDTSVSLKTSATNTITLSSNNCVELENTRNRVQALCNLVARGIKADTRPWNMQLSKSVYFLTHCVQSMELLRLLHGVTLDKCLPLAVELEHCLMEQYLTNPKSHENGTLLTDHVSKHFVGSPLNCDYEAVLSNMVEKCSLFYSTGNYFLSMANAKLMQAKQEANLLSQAHLRKEGLSYFSGALGELDLDEACLKFLEVNGIPELVHLASAHGSWLLENKGNETQSFNAVLNILKTLYSSGQNDSRVNEIIHWILLSKDNNFQRSLHAWLVDNGLMRDVFKSTVFDKEALEQLEIFLLIDVLGKAYSEEALNVATNLISWFYVEKIAEPRKAIQVLMASAEVKSHKISFLARSNYIKNAVQIARASSFKNVNQQLRRQLHGFWEMANLQGLLLEEAKSNGTKCDSLLHSLLLPYEQLKFAAEKNCMASELRLLQNLKVGTKEEILSLWTRILKAEMKLDDVIKTFEKMASQVKNAYLPIREIIELLEEICCNKHGKDSKVIRSLLKVVKIECLLETYLGIIEEIDAWEVSKERFVKSALLLVKHIFGEGKMSIFIDKAAKLVTTCEEVLKKADKLETDNIFELVVEGKIATGIDAV